MVQLIESGLQLPPFDEPVGSLSLLDLNFRDFVDREIARAQERIELPNLHLVDHALITAPVLEAFAKAAQGRPSRLALAADSPMRWLAPVSSVESKDGLLLYDVFLNAQGSDLASLRSDTQPAVLELQQPIRERPLHRAGPPPHQLDLPGGGAVVAHVENWVHMLWCAPLLVPALLARKPGKKHRSRRCPVASYVGEGATIHPTALVEGSVIGPGAEIGAGCIVRHSYIGADSIISDATMVLHSVFGEKTHTLADARFQEIVALGRGTLASMGLKDVLLGRDVFITSGVMFWSEAMETVSVEHQGQLHDTGRKSLGGCAGHGCVLGARTIVAAGRVLPNRTTVVMRKEEGVQRLQDGQGAPMCWDNAALVPVESVAPSHIPEEVQD